MKSVDKVDLKEKMFDFAFHEALNDATNQKAFKGDKTVIEKKGEVKKIIRAYIDTLLVSKNQSKKPLAVKDVAENVKKKIKNDSFTFGNTQKLINMTAKYMYLACYYDKNDNMRECFKSCDCPMDRRMINKIYSKYKEEYVNKGIGNKELLIIPYKKDVSGLDKSKISWSRIVDKETDDITSYKIYENYQKMAEEIAGDMNLYPIELDFVFWEP